MVLCEKPDTKPEGKREGKRDEKPVENHKKRQREKSEEYLGEKTEVRHFVILERNLGEKKNIETKKISIKLYGNIAERNEAGASIGRNPQGSKETPTSSSNEPI